MLGKELPCVLFSGGKVESQNPVVLLAGPHQIRVHVRSSDEKRPFDKEALIAGNFPADHSLRLRSSSPKMSFNCTGRIKMPRKGLERESGYSAGSNVRGGVTVNTERL